MKKLLFLLVAANGMLSAIAQKPIKKAYTKDKDLSRWVIDVNFLGGGYSQTMDVANTAPNYPNGINVNTGTTGMKNGSALGADGQIGFFFGKNRHWGVGTGLLYMRETANVTLDNFHAEYQSTDNNGFTFRQVVTANSINEKIKTDNFNIPLVLKYKNRFSKHWGFAADAGALFNLQMKNNYSTNASIDYEAIYKFANNSDGTTTPVYETATVPASNDFLITKAQFIKNNSEGNVQEYFAAKSSQGYNVGLGITPKSKTGSVSYKTGSVGLLLQPSINYFFSDHVALNVGVYYLYQPFANDVKSNYMLTNKTGEYSSVLNSATHVQTQSYGGNIGLRFFLGKKAAQIHITSTSSDAPTECGLCNGDIVLHGLTPGKTATVNYTVNESKENVSYSGVVPNDSSVKLSGLCSGSYSNIKATIGRKEAGTGNVTLSEPAFVVSSAQFTNPTMKGSCDGTITLNGMNTSQTVTVSYALNNVQQPTKTATVADHSTRIQGLCEGSYTNIVVSTKKCSATLANPSIIVLAAPAPIATEVTNPTTVTTETSIDAVLFNFNKADIHPSSYPALDRAYDELKENKKCQNRSRW